MKTSIIPLTPNGNVDLAQNRLTIIFPNGVKVQVPVGFKSSAYRKQSYGRASLKETQLLYRIEHDCNENGYNVDLQRVVYRKVTQ